MNAQAAEIELKSMSWNMNKMSLSQFTKIGTIAPDNRGELEAILSNTTNEASRSLKDNDSDSWSSQK